MKKNNIYIIGLEIIFLFACIIGTYIHRVSTQAVGLHNLGNASYVLSQELVDSQEEYLQDALAYYSGSLALQEHSDTRFNYNFVENLLKKQEEQKKGQEQKNDEAIVDENSQEESEEEQEGDGEVLKGLPTSREEEYRLEESQSIGEMTQEEKQFIEEAIENLEKEQIYNQQFFNKKPQEVGNPFETMRKRIFGEIDSGGEKDW